MAKASQSPAGVHKGRGATLSPANRFSPRRSEWDEGPAGPSPVTECRRIEARTIIARNRSEDVPFGQSINPYQGCEHGCIYCYARPTHAYLDLSPGLDFETRLTYKANAADKLEQELARPGYRCAGITIGANTDPYQPIEKELRITRQLLEVMLRTRHPVSVITKSALILRDVDLLAELAGQNLCSVAISVTCLDDDLKRQLEPRAASAQARLNAMAALTGAGVPVTLLFAPVIPALNDADMEDILSLAADAGARDAAYILLRLPLEIAELFQDWLRTHYPLRADHVMSLVRQCRGGKDNDSRFGHRMRGTGTFADLLAQRFRVACKRLDLGRREQPALRTDLFQAPLDPGARRAGQFDLFTR